MKYSLLLIVGLLLISSCTPDEDCHGGVVPSSDFMLVSEADLDQIIYGQKYNVDSIRLEVNGTNIISHYTKFEDDFFQGRTRFYLDTRLDLSIYNDSLYYLYLDYTDVDTLQIKSIPKINCNNEFYSSIAEIIHNGKDTLRNQTSYGIKK